ncbi:MAG: sulfatase-like hydrolase/transferase [Bacilli bacterium]
MVLIIADDLGFGDLSCAGASAFKTPNIDSLASRGIVFQQGYATASTCTPSRYSMFTGEYAWRQKKSKTGILAGDDPLCIPTNVITLQKFSSRRDTPLAAVGKWHLGLGDGSAPLILIPKYVQIQMT